MAAESSLSGTGMMKHLAQKTVNLALDYSKDLGNVLNKHKHKTEPEIIQYNIKHKKWTTRDGKAVDFKDMDTLYLSNCLNAIKNKQIDNHLYEPYIPILEKELKSRKKY